MLKTASKKIYLFYSWIFCPIWTHYSMLYSISFGRKKGANKISFIDLDEISSKNLIILIGYYTSLRPTIFHQENMQCRTKSISFWALFETHYLWNTWPKWAGFLDSQHVVSETVSKVEFFEKKCSNRQVINKKSVIW